MRTAVRRVDPLRPDVRAIEEAAALLAQGAVVAFPTETVYGLGASIYSPDGLKEIFRAKGRPSDNPLIVHVNDMAQLDTVAMAGDVERSLMKRFWPGPLTLILKRRKDGDQVGVSDLVTGGLDTVAVRMPSHRVARELIRALGAPIAAPSANTSGRPSPTTAAHVLQDLNGRISMIIDGGETTFGVESTVLDTTERPFRILRPGAITPEDLRAAIGEVVLDAGGPVEGRPRSPGMKYRHYAPRQPLVLFYDLQIGGYACRHLMAKGKRVGVIVPSEHRAYFPREAMIIDIGGLDDQFSIAHNLFSSLRHMDERGVDMILAELYTPTGLFYAVNNRLRKAAGYVVLSSTAECDAL